MAVSKVGEITKIQSGFKPEVQKKLKKGLRGALRLVSRIILIPIFDVSRASWRGKVVKTFWDQITISRRRCTGWESYYHRWTQFLTHILMVYSDFFRKIWPKTLSLQSTNLTNKETICLFDNSTDIFPIGSRQERRLSQFSLNGITYEVLEDERLDTYWEAKRYCENNGYQACFQHLISCANGILIENFA